MTQEETQEEHKERGPIERAEAAAERLEAANKKAEELAQRNEELAARIALGGRSDAGSAPPEKKEETPGEYAERIMAGGDNGKAEEKPSA